MRKAWLDDSGEGQWPTKAGLSLLVWTDTDIGRQLEIKDRTKLLRWEGSQVGKETGYVCVSNR